MAIESQVNQADLSSSQHICKQMSLRSHISKCEPAYKQKGFMQTHVPLAWGRPLDAIYMPHADGNPSPMSLDRELGYVR